MKGISIPRDELTADGSWRAIGNLALVGRAYQNSADTVGSSFSSRSEGVSAGLRYTRNARRIEVRGNYRESEFSTRNIRRTMSALFATPVGPLALSGNAEVGQQDNGRRTDPIAFYRGDLRWQNDDSIVSFNVSHSEGSGRRRQRLDLLASLKVRKLELAGGAWTNRGYTAIGRSGAWTSVGLPLGAGRVLNLGIGPSPLTWNSEPSLRGLVTIRQGFALPLPFFNGANRSENDPLNQRAGEASTLASQFR